MVKEKGYNFITPTLKFCIAGLFIPGFTAFAIIGAQQGIEFLGIECSQSWIVLWTLSAIGTILTPFVFVRLMNKRLLEGHNLPIEKLSLFNLIEYTFIQCTLATFATSGKTLCYGSGGQNGLEFAFTGWMALPFLIALSFVLDNLRANNTAEINANKTSEN